MPRRPKDPDINAREEVVDQHIASKVRLRRTLLGMSQTDLAKDLGLTFQQVQKYEKGANRISTAKLIRLAEVLDVPLSYFFDGIEGVEFRSSPDEADSSNLAGISRRELSLIRAWRKAPREVAEPFFALLRTLVGHGEADHDAHETTAAESSAETAPVLKAERTPEPVKPEAKPAKADLPKASSTKPKYKWPDPPQAPAPKAKPKNTEPKKQRRPRGAVWSPQDIR